MTKEAHFLKKIIEKVSDENSIINSANDHTTELDTKPHSNDSKMSHVQAVTVLEASQQSDKKINNNVNGKSHNITKRSAYKDTNNNEQQITKESLNVTPTDSDEPQEYTLLGLVTFKSPIKWLNSISIILIHLIFVYGFLSYPLQGGILTTIWGKLEYFFFIFLING